jgi:hypothetical protein
LGGWGEKWWWWGKRKEEEGSFWALSSLSLATCHVLLFVAAAKNNCGGCLLLNAYRVLEGVHPFPISKNQISIHPSIHQWLYNLYNSPFLDEFIITWYLIKYPSIHQWLYNLY